LYGIPIRIHPLLWIVLVCSALTGHLIELLVLFGVVFIHEMGHASAAACFRWRVKEIRLLPFGGVAEMEEDGNIPAWQELLVVLAGPLQNAIMISVAFLCRAAGWWSASWTDYFMDVNLMIALFNLMPVYPLDGGRLIRIVLGLWWPYYRTLHVTTTVSLMLCAIMIAVSLGLWNASVPDLNLFMIGLYLLASNWSDYRHLSYTFIRFLMGRESRMAQKLERGAVAKPIVASARSTVGQIVKQLMREHYHVIYVCDEFGKIRQVLPEQRLIDAYLTGKKEQDRVKSRRIRYNKIERSERRM